MAKMKLNRRALSVKHGVSRDVMRHALNCVKVTPKECIATDGRILVKVDNWEHQDDDAEGEVLIPPSVLKFIEKMFGPASMQLPVELEEIDGKLRVKGFDDSGEITLTACNLEAKFPEYEKVVPKDTEHVFTLDVKLMERIIKAAKAASVTALSFRTQGEKYKAMEIRGIGSGCVEFKAIIMPWRKGFEH